MTLGERLKAARIREKLSQEFVAKEVGVIEQQLVNMKIMNVYHH